jgi:hypothetical protein
VVDCLRWIGVSHVLRCIAAAFAVACAMSSVATAHDEAAVGVGPREIWVGADAGPRNWLIYSGATVAPWGDIHAEGFRIRATTGYGRHEYNWNAQTLVKASKTYADALIGYQHRAGDLTAKAFVGWAYLSDLDVISANDRRTRIKHGLKGALELWLNLGESGWTSLDVSFADTRDTASVRSRLGYRILPTVSLGVETAMNHTNLAGQVQIEPGNRPPIGNGRVGAFARYEWFGGEISASAGVAGDVPADVETSVVVQTPSVYGTVNWILQF